MHSAAEKLARLPGWSECPPADRGRLARVGRVVHLPAGWTLIREHTPGDTCYVILSGQLSVRQGSATVAVLASGDVVGERALETAGIRTASVTTMTEVELLHLDYPDVRSALGGSAALRRLLVPDHDGDPAQWAKEA